MNKILSTSENERLRELQKLLGFKSQESFATVLGIKQGSLSDIYRSKDGVKVSSSIKRVLEKEYSINIDWLETGQGDMLKASDSNAISPIINYERHGVPYYNVDFICGFDLVHNDQTSNPDYYIDFKQYNQADYWINASGDSMRPIINAGDILAVRMLPEEGWCNNVLFGEIYAIVTDQNRTIKKIRKSKNGDEFIRLVPENLEEYDEQDIQKDSVRQVFQVLGCMKKLM